METDTEQHREVVLGNKQLLSMFFVGAVLLGIAFTIGYVMGKNTAVKIGDGSAAIQAPLRSRVVEPAPANEDQQPLSTPSSTPAPAPQTPREDRAPAKPAPQIARTAPKASTEDAPSSHPVAPETVSTGSYLQVAALKREDADHVVKMLRTRGFPALLGESPKEGLFRVLVGPFQSMADLSESKQKLRAAGMESIVAR